MLVNGKEREVLFITNFGLVEALIRTRGKEVKEFRREIKKVIEDLVFEEKTDFNTELKEDNEVLKAKADYYDRTLSGKELYSTTEVAKQFGSNGRALNKKLNKYKVIYKQNNTWVVYSKYNWLIKEGYASYSIGRHGQLLKWTELGRKWIIDLMDAKNEA